MSEDQQNNSYRELSIRSGFLHFALEARVSRSNENEPPHIILVEQTPHALGVYDITYHGPQRSQASMVIQRELNNVTGFRGTPNN